MQILHAAAFYFLLAFGAGFRRESDESFSSFRCSARELLAARNAVDVGVIVAAARWESLVTSRCSAVFRTVLASLPWALSW